MIPNLSRLLAAVLTACLLLTSSVSAQDEAFASHPAAKVVRDYLNLILAREWAKSGDLVEPKSLEGLKNDFVRRLREAPTMSDEEAMLKRVGKGNIEEVEKLDPKSFYTAYHFGLQERFQVTKESMEALKKSLTMRLLSLAEEDATRVHVLVRTKHKSEKGIIENLELVSLVKVGDAWKVGLNEQMPRLTPNEGGSGAAPAVESKPVPSTKPKPAPVKPKTR